MEYTTTYWLTFFAIIFGLLILDLGVFNKKSHEVSVREAIGWSAFWISISLIFAVSIFKTHGQEDASQFLTAYLLEKSLSVDNLFVFILVFKYFRIQGKEQHKVLYWGILGSLILRGLFIFFGIELISHFNFALYIFGAFLVYSGVKLFLAKEDGEDDSEDSKLLNFLNGKLGAFMACLIAIELSDIIFAVDSVPAVLSVTQKPFLVYTSNIFAILGLRSLYFALNALRSKLNNMDKSISMILTFIGVKMLISHWVHIPSWIALVVILAALIFGVITCDDTETV